MREHLFSQVTSLQPATLFKKRPHPRCFLCEFYKISNSLQISGIAGSRCFAKLVFLKLLQNSEKTPVLESLFSKVLNLQLGPLLKQRLWLSCFPVNFAKFLKTSFL